MTSTPTPTGRLAPSPTGGLHLGHARTFLIAWVSARSQGGRVILRIEDLDSGRVRTGAYQGIYDDLAWLGLNWDEGPSIQSTRKKIYESHLDRLRERELVYPCTCTKADIARAASAPHAEDEGPVYPGTCRERTALDAGKIEKAFAWRFRVPDQEVVWDDLCLGRLTLNPARHGGDFVVARSDGSISYQLAVVIDDALMNITEVVRGDDLITSTPRQMLLYEALGLAKPSFAHVPLAYGADGRRLAKRDGAIKLGSLRAEGIDPRRLMGVLARSCGWSDQVVDSTPNDWILVADPLRLKGRNWTVDDSALVEIRMMAKENM